MCCKNAAKPPAPPPAAPDPVDTLAEIAATQEQLRSQEQ